MLPPLVRAGRAPLLRLLSSSSLRTLRPRVPYGSGGSDLPLHAFPSPSSASESGPAARAAPGAPRGMSLCSRAVDIGDEASSSSAAAAGSDLSAPYLSVRIRCRKQDAEVLSEALLSFGAFSSTVDDIADAGNLDEDPHATNIIINPGLAFGAGEHPTTKLCLLLLREVIKGGEHVMDYGTGTGVLGIAALKMGAAISTGIDIDPQAVTAASENLLLNGLQSDQMPVYLVPKNLQPSCFPSNISKLEGEGNKLGSNFDLKSSRGTYDIVMANILLNPLLELVEDIVGYAKPGGMVAVSGILEEQVPKVEEIYSRYLDNMLVSVMDGWACLQGTRRM